MHAFVAVAELHSFSLAARKLFLTQPAISKRVATLESQLNHRLFDRLGKDVKLTEAGARLYPQAKAILDSLREAERTVRESSGEIIGTLRVATSHHIGLHHLPPVLREFASRHKDVNLQFEFLDSERAHEKILNRECDLAIVTLSPNVSPPLTATKLWTDPLFFVVGKDHLLAKSPSIDLARLSKEPAILPDLNTFTGRLVKAVFDQNALTLNISMATNYLETIKMMVSVGLGWSVLPATLIDGQMRALDIPGVTISRSLGVIHHERKSMGNAAKAFYQLLKAYGE